MLVGVSGAERGVLGLTHVLCEFWLLESCVRGAARRRSQRSVRHRRVLVLWRGVAIAETSSTVPPHQWAALATVAASGKLCGGRGAATLSCADATLDAPRRASAGAVVAAEALAGCTKLAPSLW